MINYGKHFIDKKDINFVKKTLKSNWLTQGPKVKIFENKLKNYLGSKYSLVVNSGTAALHLSFHALGIKKNDIILASPITFLSSVNASLYLDAKPIFIDIDKKNYCMDIKKLEAKLIELRKKNKKVKAIVVTDYAGQMCDWKKIRYLSKKYKFYSINDNCHSLGSKYYNDQKYAVKYADIVTHSFHPVKIITTGEGGSLSTNNEKFYKKIMHLRSHGVVRSNSLNKKYGSWYYSMRELGYNYRMPEINAALGISQLNKINKFLKKRKEIANRYYQKFKDNKNIILPYIEKFCNHSFHLFPIQIKFENINISKKIFFEIMKKNKINLQVHYIPIHFQNFYKKKFNFKKNFLPEAEKFYQNEVSLPVFYSLTEKSINKVVNIINKYTKI